MIKHFPCCYPVTLGSRQFEAESKSLEEFYVRIGEGGEAGQEPRCYLTVIQYVCPEQQSQGAEGSPPRLPRCAFRSVYYRSHS